jgi:predicted Zn-dependent peptidase
MDPQHYVHRLNNGMRLVMVPHQMSGLVYVSMLIRNGYIDETAHTRSFAHMGEHMCSKYTSKKFPEFDEKLFGYLGIDSDAFSDRFNTGYWLLGHKKHTSLMLQLMASTFFDYKFSDDWEKQKNILMEEIQSRHNELDERIASVLYPNHSLSATSEEDLKCILHASEHDVTRFLVERLDPKETLVLLEGDFDMNSLFSIIPKHLFNIPRPFYPYLFYKDQNVCK